MEIRRVGPDPEVARWRAEQARLWIVNQVAESGRPVADIEREMGAKPGAFLRYLAGLAVPDQDLGWHNGGMRVLATAIGCDYWDLYQRFFGSEVTRYARLADEGGLFSKDSGL